MLTSVQLLSSSSDWNRLFQLQLQAAFFCLAASQTDEGNIIIRSEKNTLKVGVQSIPSVLHRLISLCETGFV